MVWPKVSILWVNFNSYKYIDVILKSLEGLSQIDYPNYEVIIVDNGSSDLSHRVIKEWLEKNKVSKRRFKFFRLKKNLGYTGGNNFAFRIRDPESKYIVLMNNDLIPYSDSLKILVEISEQNEWIGGLQGIIETWDGGYIENMGLIVDPFLISYAIYGGYRISQARKPKLCTFVSGAYSIYRISSINDILINGKLFDEHMFGYFDDMILGMRLWMNGYKLVGVPIVSGKHYSSLTFGKHSPLSYYLAFRSVFVLDDISLNNKFKRIAPFVSSFRRIAKHGIKWNMNELNVLLYVLYRAWLVHKKLSRRIKYKIDLSKVPLSKLGVLPYSWI